MDSPAHDQPSEKAADEAATRLAASEALLQRARSLQSELEALRSHVLKVYEGYFQQFPTEMHLSFSSSMRAEIEGLERAVQTASSTDPLASHRAQSTNLPFLEAVWDTAKRSRDIVKLRRPVFTGTFKKQLLAPGTRIVQSMGDSRPGGNSFVIDVIADGGLSWFKVSSMTNRKLLFDMAKEAIYCGDSDDDELDEAHTQDYTDIPLLKLAKNLAQTAQGHRIRNRSPTPYLVLPRIEEREHMEIDKVLAMCRGLGVDLLCSNALTPPPPLSDNLLHTMVPGPKANFSESLNMDTSVLVALASDFSHMTVAKQPWFSHSHNDHSELETQEAMVSQVYPILGGNELVCTKEAAETFSHIVNTIATDAESARAHLLLNVDPDKSREQRIQELRDLSIHDVPSDLQLPIHIVDAKENICQARFNSIITKKLSNMPNPGRSVFSYGWASGRTTVTCNAVAIKQLEKSLEQLPDLNGLEWPSMWAFNTSRPLVGTPRSEGSRRRVRKHIGDCREVCTCGVQELYGDKEHVTII